MRCGLATSTFVSDDANIVEIARKTMGAWEVEAMA